MHLAMIGSRHCNVAARACMNRITRKHKNIRVTFFRDKRLLVYNVMTRFIISLSFSIKICNVIIIILYRSLLPY